MGRFAYTGQIVIPELRLYYYKARIYSPRLGRFLQTDPIGYADQINLYAYVGNDPLNRSDPTGMDEACATAAGYCTSTAASFITKGGGLTSDLSKAEASYGVDIGQQIANNSSNGSSPQNSHQFTPPDDGSDDIVVTARNQIPDSQKYVLAGGRFYRNPSWVDPAPWLNLPNFMATQAVLGAVAVTPAVPALTARSTGLFNCNDYVRWGFNWKGSAKDGEQYFDWE